MPDVVTRDRRLRDTAQPLCDFSIDKSAEPCAYSFRCNGPRVQAGAPRGCALWVCVRCCA